jgi:hypothetical protein
VVSNGAGVAVFNSNYMTSDPQNGEYETIGLFIASKGVPPAWPAGSKLETSDVQKDRVTLTWPNATDSKGIKEYRIYKNDIISATVNASTLTHTVMGLEAGKAYVFRVEAVNANNVMSTGGPSIVFRTPPDDQTFDLTWRLDRVTADNLPYMNSKLFITGIAKGGRTMQATVSYKTWLDEGGNRLPSPRTAEMLIQMNETAQASGEYAGTFAIIEGIAELSSLKATLSDGAGGSIQRQAVGLPLAVSGNLKIELNNPGNQNTEDAYISVLSRVHSGRSVKVDGSPVTVEGLAPGEDYESTLISAAGRQWSANDEIRIYPGLNTTLTMNIPQEALFRFKLADQDGNAVPSILVDLWDGENTEFLGNYVSGGDGYTAWVRSEDINRTFTARFNLEDTNYEPVPDQKIALKQGDNEITVKLQRSPTGILQGRVLDQPACRFLMPW